MKKSMTKIVWLTLREHDFNDKFDSSSDIIIEKNGAIRKDFKKRLSAYNLSWLRLSNIILENIPKIRHFVKMGQNFWMP